MLRNGDACDLLQTTPTGYVLRAPSTDLDLSLFEQLVAEGRARFDDRDMPGAAETLAKAEGLWGGAPFADIITGELLSAHITRLNEAKIAAQELRIQAELDLGRHHTLIGELKQLCSANPFHEGFRAKLMLALYRSGRRSEALDVYQEIRQTLVTELGIEPSSMLTDLQSGLLSSAPSLDLPAPDADQSQAAAERPQPRVQAETLSVPAQLPPSIGDLVGRYGLLKTVDDALAAESDPDGPPRLIALVGMPGVGKSTISIEAAHRARGRFSDGQFFAALEGSSSRPKDPAVVLYEFLRSVGLPANEIPANVNERGNLFRTWAANRSVLILLDDVESEAQIRPLFPGNARSSLLLTSRTTLHVLPGIRQVEVDVLSSEESIDLLATIVGQSRVQQEVHAAEDLVQLCGGLPSALRCVASQIAAIPGGTIGTFVRRLANHRTCLDTLQVADNDLRSDFDSIYCRLCDKEASAFRLLSLLQQPSFGISRAAGLLGWHHDVAEEVLIGLSLRHLLMAAPTADGRTQYRFHRLVRLYAAERLEEVLQSTDPDLPGPIGTV